MGGAGINQTPLQLTTPAWNLPANSQSGWVREGSVIPYRKFLAVIWVFLLWYLLGSTVKWGRGLRPTGGLGPGEG